MTTRLLAVSLALLGATLVGCEADSGGTGGGDCPGCDGGAGGEYAGSGGNGGAGPLTGEGEDQDGDGGGAATTGTAGPSVSSSNGGGAGTPGDCADCCQGTPFAGPQQVAVRVQDSNAFASPALVRALLPEWDGEDPLPVRPQEFLNAFAPAVPEPSGPEVSVDAAAAPHAGAGTGTLFDLQIAVRQQAVDLPPRSVAVLVDTSPSARAAIERVMGAVDAVLDQVRPADSVAVFTWTLDPARRVLRPFATLGELPLDREVLRESVQREIEDTVERVTMGPAVLAAIGEAAVEAEEMQALEGAVILVSDGVSGIDDESLAAVKSAATDPGLPVRVMGVGVGAARSYGDAVLDRISDAGGGAHVYFDGSEETEAFLGSKFEQLVSVAHAEVRIQLDLPKALEVIALSEEPIDEEDASVSEGGTVRGQPLAAGGTMTFHEVLRWTDASPPDPCMAIGWSVLARSSGATTDEVLATGTLALGDVAGLRHATAALREGQAVLAASAALQGPTPARLGGAVNSLREVGASVAEAGGTWQDHDLRRLCALVEQACERRGLDCGSCDLPVEP